MHKKIPSLPLSFLCLLMLVPVLGLSAQNGVTFDPQKIMHIENYAPMPGDIYTLALDYGGRDQSPASYSVMLQEDYTLELPYLGTFSIKGMYFAEARNTIVRRIKAIVPLQYVSFTLSSPAKFDIFVFGQVKTPGFRTVTSLTRLSDAVAMAGGFQPGAGVRKIEITGKSDTEMYDYTSYAAFGSIGQNPYLKPGDKVYVPQREAFVTLGGAVTVPGQYEILPGETLETVIQHAGGLTETASVGGIGVLRLNDRNEYEVLTERIEPASFTLKSGDRVTVRSTLENIEQITVEGAVFGAPVTEGAPQTIPAQPLRFRLPYHAGITLLELLESVGGPTPFAEEDRAYLIRKSTGTRTALPDLIRLWETKDASLDLPLEADDYLVIPIKKLRVFVSGEVNGPGSYDYIEGYTVSDYLLAAGGIDRETGSRSGIYKLDRFGAKTKTGLESPVQPADHIFVDRNGWTKTQNAVGDVFVVTGWVSVIIALFTSIFELVNLVK